MRDLGFTVSDSITRIKGIHRPLKICPELLKMIEAWELLHK